VVIEDKIEESSSIPDLQQIEKQERATKELRSIEQAKENQKQAVELA
jgi:cell fate (sporulation/competence/biofilm development) regulator YmcA (YheA/YmcA/DUF963 family)